VKSIFTAATAGLASLAGSGLASAFASGLSVAGVVSAAVFGAAAPNGLVSSFLGSVLVDLSAALSGSAGLSSSAGSKGERGWAVRAIW
jgi:hypothetical protein